MLFSLHVRVHIPLRPCTSQVAAVWHNIRHPSDIRSGSTGGDIGHKEALALLRGRARRPCEPCRNAFAHSYTDLAQTALVLCCCLVFVLGMRQDQGRSRACHHQACRSCPHLRAMPMMVHGVLILSDLVTQMASCTQCARSWASALVDGKRYAQRVAPGRPCKSKVERNGFPRARAPSDGEGRCGSMWDHLARSAALRGCRRLE